MARNFFADCAIAIWFSGKLNFLFVKKGFRAHILISILGLLAMVILHLYSMDIGIHQIATMFYYANFLIYIVLVCLSIYIKKLQAMPMQAHMPPPSNTQYYMPPPQDQNQYHAPPQNRAHNVPPPQIAIQVRVSAPLAAKNFR